MTGTEWFASGCTTGGDFPYTVVGDTGYWWNSEVYHPDIVDGLIWRNRSPLPKRYERGLRTIPIIESKQRTAHFLSGVR